jgi:hypothetical protein
MQRQILFSGLIKKSQTRRKLEPTIKKSQKEISQEVNVILQILTLYIKHLPVNQKSMYNPNSLVKEKNPMDLIPKTIFQAFGLDSRKNSQIPETQITIPEFDRFGKKNLVKRRSHSQPGEVSCSQQTQPKTRSS